MVHGYAAIVHAKAPTQHTQPPERAACASGGSGSLPTEPYLIDAFQMWYRAYQVGNVQKGSQ